MLHPQYRNTTLRNNSFFGENICNGFLCPAHSILSAEQKKIIIKLIDDWYLYSIAIIDPESTIWILNLIKEHYPIAYQKEDVLKKIINDALMIHARYLDCHRGPVFYYSVSEYNIGKKNFSIGFTTMEQDREIQDINEVIEHYL